MSSSAGKKRGADGQEAAESSITDEQLQLVENSRKTIDKAELFLELQAIKHLQPYYAKRRDLLKGIPKFWPTALSNHPGLGLFAVHASDQEALAFVEDLWIERDPKEPRAFKAEFHFAENPFFTNKVLVKEFKRVEPPASDSTVDEDGLTPDQVDFDPDRDLKVITSKIEWKSDEKNLVKLYPKSINTDDDGEVQDSGTIFNWFVNEEDDGLSVPIVEVFEGAENYFLGRTDEDITDSEEEEEDDADEEIDLEQPRKKVRHG